jgi:DnaK suppressor protein
MNATVTRSATKSAGAKNVNKSTTAAASKKSVKRPTRSATGAIEPVSDAARKTTKTNPKKTAEPAVKLATKTATKVATKVATKTAAKAGTVKSAATSGKTRTDLQHPSRVPVAKVGPKETPSDLHVSGNNASTRLRDTIGKPVVSRVNEVATKTTKPTPAIPANGALLTETQLLAMSDADYMNDAQLAFFKARLQQLERDLLKNAGETTEHLRETVLVPDPADRATIEEEHALELRTRDRERKLLKKVQQSIASIDAGDYGWCEETGEPIGIPRLLARPTATLSLEAQQRRELKQKLYGD